MVIDFILAGPHTTHRRAVIPVIPPLQDLCTLLNHSESELHDIIRSHDMSR